MSRAGRSDPCFGSKTHSNEKFADRMFVGKEKARRVAPRNKQLPSSNLFTKSVSREIERRVGTKTATSWARNRLNLRSTGIEYMYNAKYMYCSS